jgi:hypothetical protein
LAPAFTIVRPAATIAIPPEKIPCRRQTKPQNQIKVMGDKSPKANQKKSGQKQSKTSSASAKKNAAVAAKSAAGKKK